MQSSSHATRARCILALAAVVVLAALPLAAAEQVLQPLEVRLSWGHRSTAARPFRISFLPNNVIVTQTAPDGFEAGDTLHGGVCETRAGAGDVDAVTANISYAKPVKPPRKPQSIWQHLLDHGEPGQVARLKDDPGLQPDAPVLTVQTAADGTQGFSFGLEQLARHKAMWLPEHDVYVTLADAPVDFAAHLASLKGERVLDRVKHEPAATLAEWTNKWADFGNPTKPHHGHETELRGAKGHHTGFVARHGSIYKFGVDRWGRARPDLSFAHKFRFDPLWPDWQWTGQRIVDGLPLLVTTCEREGQRCEVEQIVEPLRDTPPAKRGEIPGVLLGRFRFSGPAGPLSFGFSLATESTNRHPELREVGGRWCVVDRETGSVWLMVEPGPGLKVQPRAAIADEQDPRIEFACVGERADGETCDILVKLPSPAVPAAGVEASAALDYAKARAATGQYWEGWLAARPRRRLQRWRERNTPIYKVLAHYGAADAYARERNVEAALAEYDRVLALPKLPAHLTEETRLRKVEVTGGSAFDDMRTTLPVLPKPAVEFFVAVDGKDENPRTLEKPFATLTRARDAVRAARRDGALPVGGATVYVNGGEYPVSTTFELTREDSGTAIAPVVYRNHRKEKVTFYGGKRVTRFRPVADADVLMRVKSLNSGA